MRYLLPLILVFLGKTVVSIIAGVESIPHAFPSIVRVNLIADDFAGCKDNHCGMCEGTIINEEWILSNGDCCRLRTGTLRPVRDITITIGAHYDATCDFSKTCGTYYGVNGRVDGFVKKVEEVVLHPQYKPMRGRHDKNGIKWDACLLRVEAFDIEEGFAQQAKLPVKHIAPVYPESGASDHPSCIIAGWGTTEMRSLSPVLLQTNTTIFSNNFCNTQTRMKGSQIMEEFAFCAGVVKEQAKSRYNGDACQGDSGGPLYCTVDGNTVQYGIISWGQGCGEKNRPGIYTNIAAISDWIRNTVAADGIGQTYPNFQTGYPDFITLNGPMDVMSGHDKVLKGVYINLDVTELKFADPISYDPGLPVYFRFLNMGPSCSIIYYSKGAWNLRKCELAKNTITSVIFTEARFTSTTSEPIKMINNLQNAEWVSNKGATVNLQFSQ